MLKEIYNGEVIPRDWKNRENSEMFNINQSIKDVEEYFKRKMTLEDYEHLQKLTDLYSDLLTAGEIQIFSYGFAMGLLLFRDVMDAAEAMKTE